MPAPREKKGMTSMPATHKEADVPVSLKIGSAETQTPVSFTLKIGGAEAGTFKEATALASESDAAKIKRSMPNGRTDVIKAMGNTKWGDIELKRGVDNDKTLWNWRKLIADGHRSARKDCTVTMLDYEGTPVVTYSINNAWPERYEVGLKADSNEVAVEGITLCHEGFEIQ
jgi:phage tail-like protein